MKRSLLSLYWALPLLIVLLCLPSGCGKKQPDPETAQTEQPAPDAKTEAEETPEDDPTAEQKEELAKAQAKAVKDAGKTAAGEDIDEALGSIEQLKGLLATDDADLAADVAKVLVDVVAGQSGEDPRVRAAAIEALATQADAFVDVLITASGDANPIVRDAAILALGRSAKGSQGERRLKELLASADPDVRDLAKRALSAVGQGGDVGEVATLVAQLGKPENDQSAQAAIKLKLMGEAALPELERAVRTGRDGRQRHAAAMCIALICAGTNPSQEKFAKSAKSVKKGDQRGNPSNLKGLPILIDALKDPEPMVREIAAQGLGYLGSEKAARPLAEALKDEDVHVRRRAAAALITTPAQSVVKDVIQTGLYDKDETVRRFAVEALGWIGGPEVVKALIVASRDESAEVRRYAAVQLGRASEPAALDALIALYEDAKKRELAAATLDEKSREQDVRWAAVQAVAEMRDRRSTKMLVAALDDPVPQVANAAETGLQKLGIAKRRLPGAD
jgi:HEAT repeat protein